MAKKKNTKNQEETEKVSEENEQTEETEDEETVDLTMAEKRDLQQFSEFDDADSDPDIDDDLRSADKMIKSGIGSGSAPKEPRPEGQEEKDTRTVVMETTIKELFSKKDLNMKADLSTKQIKAYARGLLFTQRYDSEVMGTFIGLLMELSVSKQRKGRQEMSGIINQTSSGMIDEEGSSAHLMDKLLLK